MKVNFVVDRGLGLSRKVWLRGLLRGLLLGLTLGLNTACSGPAPSQAGASEAKSGTQAASRDAVVATIAVGKAPHALAADARYLYCLDSGENQLAVVDPQSFKVRAKLKLKNAEAESMTFDEAGNLLIPDPSGKTLQVVSSGAAPSLKTDVPVGQGPDDLVWEDETLFVSLMGENLIAELEWSSAEGSEPEVRYQAVGRGSHSGSALRLLTVGETWLAVPNPGDNDLSLVHLPDGKTQTVQAGNDPGPVAMGALDDQDAVLLIGNRASQTITLYDLSSGQQQDLSEVGLNPTEVLLLPELERAYFSMAGSNEITVVDYRLKKVIGKVSVGARPVHLVRAPELPAEMTVQHHQEAANLGQEIWVGNDADGTVSVIDGQTLAVKVTLKVGQGHHKFAFWQNLVFISNYADNTLSVVDRQKL